MRERKSRGSRQDEPVIFAEGPSEETYFHGITQRLAGLLKHSRGEPRWNPRPLSPEVLLTSAVTEGARLTLIILTCLADENGSVTLQTKDLADALGCVDRAVQRRYRQLERAKFLKVERAYPLTNFRIDFARVVADDRRHPPVRAA